LAGLLLGPVSERLARRPPCPVVVVRGSRSAWSGPVVVGIDDAPETELAVEFAVTAADRRRVPLVALTAVPPVWAAPSAAFPAESASTAEVAMAMLRELQDDSLGPALARHPVGHRGALDDARGSRCRSGCSAPSAVTSSGTPRVRRLSYRAARTVDQLRQDRAPAALRDRTKGPGRLPGAALGWGW